MLASAWTDINQPVGLTDRVLIVFNHNQGVAQVSQTLKRADESVVVALVEADRRLVQDVHDPDQARADLGGQTDTLGLTSGQGCGSTRHGQVVQTHVAQEAQPRFDFLEDFPSDLSQGTLQVQSVDPGQALCYGHVTHFGD